MICVLSALLAIEIECIIIMLLVARSNDFVTYLKLGGGGGGGGAQDISSWW